MNDILSRLENLEDIVLGRQRRTKALDPSFDRRMTKRQLAQQRAQSTKSVDRAVKAGLLPPPEYENGRAYWWLSKIQEHERQRREAEAA